MSLEFFVNTDLFAHDQELRQILASARKAGVRVYARGAELEASRSPKHLPECALAAG
jgi:hypothetical protein